MGNRAVLCLREVSTQKFSECAVGIYLHWNGSPDQVSYYLEKARKVMDGRMGDTEYAKARLIGVISNEIEGNLSLGVGIVGQMDYNNGNNGTYIIDCSTLSITGREYHE
jgi:hypothetical protein